MVDLFSVIRIARRLGYCSGAFPFFSVSLFFCLVEYALSAAKIITLQDGAFSVPAREAISFLAGRIVAIIPHAISLRYSARCCPS